MIDRLKKRPQFWLLCALLAAVFVVGGASRSDVLPLILLRPFGVCLLFVGVLTVERDQLMRHRAIVALFTATVALVAIHLVPLPPAIWHGLPGRALIASIDQAAGLGQVWRPLALSPSDGWNALYALSIPGAVLLLSIQLRERELYFCLVLVVALGMVGSLVSLFQVAGDPNGPLYFYSITNNGSAVGFFSNRNHQALMIATLFPLLAGLAATAPAFLSNSIVARWSAVAMACILPPLLLVTGSRSGFVTGVLGMAMALVVYTLGNLPARTRRTGRKPLPQWVKVASIGTGLALLMAVTALLSRAEAIRRLVASDATDDLRLKVWGPIFRASLSYMPFGSGAGSFVPVYQVVEPDTLLLPAYLNHAHNDWLEVWLTMGIAGTVLLVIASYWFVRRALGIAKMLWLRSERNANLTLAFAVTGVIALLLIGSLLDYPLRTPALAGLLALCAVVCDRFRLAQHHGGRTNRSES